jgi:hypothetical protein
MLRNHLDPVTPLKNSGIRPRFQYFSAVSDLIRLVVPLGNLASMDYATLIGNS